MATKFEREDAIINEIIQRGEYTLPDHITAMKILQTPMHDSGKIEGIQSCDSTCTNCHFCQQMREAAQNNPSIICGMCYDYTQEHSYKGRNVLNRHTLQLKIMTHFRFSVEELKSLRITSLYFRHNSSGDIQLIEHGGLNQMSNIINMALAFPRTNFRLWAKNVKTVQTAFDMYGHPENLLWVQSSPVIGRPCTKSKHAYITFTVYANEEEVKAAMLQGANECNGKKCAECGFKCYDPDYGWTEGTDVAELLRKK